MSSRGASASAGAPFHYSLHGDSSIVQEWEPIVHVRGEGAPSTADRLDRWAGPLRDRSYTLGSVDIEGGLVGVAGVFKD